MKPLLITFLFTLINLIGGAPSGRMLSPLTLLYPWDEQGNWGALLGGPTYMLQGGSPGSQCGQGRPPLRGHPAPQGKREAHFQWCSPDKKSQLSLRRQKCTGRQSIIMSYYSGYSKGRHGPEKIAVSPVLCQRPCFNFSGFNKITQEEGSEFGERPLLFMLQRACFLTSMLCWLT